ncbi:MAG: hypothetical protein K2P81_00370 [Bacteriovoracaceae bacterium]|nr:hypothetical protein [Bacteriovoracaceae bacterium]
MIRSWMLALSSAILFSFACFSQTPLPVDSNTIALWNFDTDAGDVVADVSGNGLVGIAYFSQLRQIQPGGPLNNGRYFLDQRSHIRFGQLTPSSPLNLMALNEWSVEFVTYGVQFPGGGRNIFDNGQINISFQDLRYVVTLNVNGMKYGLKSNKTYPGVGISRSVAVVYSNGKLGIFVNGLMEGMTEISILNKKNKSTYGQWVRVGGTPTEGVIDFFNGRNHACLKNEIGDIKCWGNNDNGQLGDHTQANYYPMPVLAEGLTGVSDLSLGERFTCALRGTSVGCWGFNQNLNLGTSQWWSPVLFPDSVQGLTNAVSVASGLNHSCSLTTDKKVYCWGKNDFGQLGQTNYSPGALAAPVNGILNAKQVAVGSSHVCALLESNEVLCWGKNNRGQIGHSPGVTPNSATPLLLNISGVRQVVAGDDYSCVLKNDESVWCWGANDFGQLGIGALGDSSVPVQVTGLPITTFKNITASNGSHTCVVTSSGRPWCWGRNDRGQLWIPNSTTYSTTALASPVLNSENYKAGGRNNCYIRQSEKALYCEGSNSFGLLGDFSPIAYANGERYVLSTRLGQFNGILDDIRISNIARFSLNRPVLNLVAPVAQQSVPRPNISISVISTIALDMNTIAIKLNGQPTSGLVLNGQYLEGQLATDLLVGKNTLEVQVKDTQGGTGILNVDLRYYTQSQANSPMKVLSRNNNSCYLEYDGDLWCWGSNEFGQLGLADRKAHSSPIKNSLINDLIDFEMSQSTICGVNRANEIYCWGSNGFGELGSGIFIASSFYPEKVTLSGSVQKLISGYGGFCAILTNGGVSCWGENRFQRFGLIDYIINTPTPFPGLANIVSGTIAQNHTCFINSTGQTFCTGNNNLGQLGDGTFNSTTSPVQSLIVNAKSISAGVNHTCAIDQNDQSFCWGKNNFLELGINSNLTASNYNYPNPVEVAADLENITVGESFTCGKSVAGQVTCWGQNAHTEMGNGSRSRNEIYYTIPDISFEQISTLGNTVCGITIDKQLYCWGANLVGEAGNANGEYTSIPTIVTQHTEMISTLSGLIAGQANSCMNKDGSLFCWGNNERSQLGIQSGNFVELYPVPMSGAQGALQTSIGYALICHVTPSKNVTCSGFNNFGQAGQDKNLFSDVQTPLQVGSLSSMKQVEAGLDYSCALNESGEISCWGNNIKSQLGRTGGDSHIPSLVSNHLPSKFLAVAQRGYHSCAITNDNKVGCWGANSNGQLGFRGGADIPSFNVVKELGIDNASVSLGANFSCVLKQDGKVICFGANSYGQLGIGTTLGNGSFQTVTLPQPVVSLKAGENHVCALDNLGAVYCWGQNLQGQLGIGNTQNSSYPTKVLDGIAEIASGAEHTCALTTQNKLVCWGFNGNAQFGNGSILSSRKPIFSDVTKK